MGNVFLSSRTYQKQTTGKKCFAYDKFNVNVSFDCFLVRAKMMPQSDQKKVAKLGKLTELLENMT